MSGARTQSDSKRPAGERTARVFISYSRNDSAWVRDLRRAGDRCRGLELYSFPYEEAPPGGDWQQTFRGLIREADGLVCLVGEATSQNANIAWELDEAAGRGVPILLTGRGARGLADQRRGLRMHTLESSSPDAVVARLQELV